MDGNGRWAASAGCPASRVIALAPRRFGEPEGRRRVGRRSPYALCLFVRKLAAVGRGGQPISRACSAIISSGSSTAGARGRPAPADRGLSGVWARLVARLDRAVERTSQNDRLTLVVAFNYGARDEIAAAARRLAEKAAAGELDPSRNRRASLESELSTHGLPELDLVIRTSGEKATVQFPACGRRLMPS